MRTTIVDVRVAFTAYLRQLGIMGYDTSGVDLVHTQNGPYRAVIGSGTKGAPGTRHNGLIGHTASEAYATLHTMTNSLKFATEWSVEHIERVNR